jgi:hypothetical protein
MLNSSDTTLHRDGYWVLNSFRPETLFRNTAIAYCSNLSGHRGCDVWGRHGCALRLTLELILTAYSSARSSVSSRNNCAKAHKVDSLSVRASRVLSLKTT